VVSQSCQSIGVTSGSDVISGSNLVLWSHCQIIHGGLVINGSDVVSRFNMDL